MPDAAGPSSSEEVGHKRDGDALEREVSEKRQRIDAIITHWASEDGGRYGWGDVRDVPLDLAKVEGARLEEMNFMIEQNVYTSYLCRSPGMLLASLPSLSVG